MIPENAKMMALTTTATHTSRKEICGVLGMENPAVVSVGPNRPNIEYEIRKTKEGIEETFIDLVEEVQNLRTAMNRLIIFCRNYDDAGYIYAFLVNKLGKEALHPIGAPNSSRYRLLDLFTVCTPSSVKLSIIENFTSSKSPLRVAVATIAFGMGLDCPSVRRIIN